MIFLFVSLNFTIGGKKKKSTVQKNNKKTHKKSQTVLAA